MSGATSVLLLWIGFAATHMGLSSQPLRQKLVERLGERAFLGLYSLIAFAFFVPLLWVYFATKDTGTSLWVLPVGPVLLWAIYLGMGIAFVLMAASFTQPNPTSLVPGRPTPRGVLRITRHPLFMGIALWGALHLVVAGSTPDVAFFGGMVVFSLVGSWHQDRRKLALEVPGYREFCAGAPFLPFTGSATAQGLRELPPLAIVMGIAITVVLRLFHATLFGP
jgi:uncharacterized membrane protein